MQCEGSKPGPVVLQIVSITKASHLPPGSDIWIHAFEREESTDFIKVEPMKSKLSSRAIHGQRNQVTESVYFGNGTWDKIPYTVASYTEIHVACAPGDEEAEARRVQELVSGLNAEFLRQGVMDMADMIVDDLYPDRFPDSMRSEEKD